MNAMMCLEYLTPNIKPMMNDMSANDTPFHDQSTLLQLDNIFVNIHLLNLELLWFLLLPCPRFPPNEGAWTANCDCVTYMERSNVAAQGQHLLVVHPCLLNRNENFGVSPPVPHGLFHSAYTELPSIPTPLNPNFWKNAKAAGLSLSILALIL